MREERLSTPVASPAPKHVRGLTMNLPGYTAEASLLRAGAQYASVLVRSLRGLYPANNAPCGCDDCCAFCQSSCSQSCGQSPNSPCCQFCLEKCTSTYCSNCISCTGGMVCQDGVCVCPPSLTDCDGTCTDTQSDPNNCGDCGVVCPPGNFCLQGQCLFF